MNFDDADPEALKVLLRSLYGSEEPEPSQYCKDCWTGVDVRLNTKVLARADKYSVMKLISMTQAYFEKQATADYITNAASARSTVEMLAHASFEEDACEAYNKTKERVADCVAGVFSGLQEQMNDFLGEYGDLRIRVLRMALEQYSGMIVLA